MTIEKSASRPAEEPLNPTELACFERDGFLIQRGLADKARCEALAAIVDASLNPALAPLEYEADVHYPGAPDSREAQGGLTPRRLLHAYTRHPLFREWAGSEAVVSRLRQLMHSREILLSQNHHNCIMTKHPGFSSMTSWHEDVRYWSFDRPELVSVWLALGQESAVNGGMQLIPGTHRATFDRGRLDAALFLRTDLAENQTLIDSAVEADLQAGDVLFFHCKTYHAAGKNSSDTVKRSLVFTYRTPDNRPIPSTRSGFYQDVPVGGK
ncbi:phytanoyl-CoA dioxygenase family protein [Granulosicoccaceae sp. 1_MG-2023]|nr:phytanoyl-CoA dioxygenase family protein [Granulosicoccaceae sp. 1_MG-2023]